MIISIHKVLAILMVVQVFSLSMPNTCLSMWMGELTSREEMAPDHSCCPNQIAPDEITSEKIETRETAKTIRLCECNDAWQSTLTSAELIQIQPQYYTQLKATYTAPYQTLKSFNSFNDALLTLSISNSLIRENPKSQIDSQRSLNQWTATDFQFKQTLLI